MLINNERLLRAPHLVCLVWLENISIRIGRVDGNKKDVKNY